MVLYLIDYPNIFLLLSKITMHLPLRGGHRWPSLSGAAEDGGWSTCTLQLLSKWGCSKVFTELTSGGGVMGK